MGAILKSKHAAVESLFIARRAQLRQFVLARLGNYFDIQDVIQDIYLRYLQVPDAEAIRSPEAYLFTIARHVVQQHGLKRRAAAPTSDLARLLADWPAEPDFDPALQFAAQETAERLQQALNQLSGRCRAAFLLHRRDGLSVEEIAAKLGISRPMVRKYLFKALVRLRGELSALD